jgi:hypothetical protein
MAAHCVNVANISQSWIDPHKVVVNVAHSFLLPPLFLPPTASISVVSVSPQPQLCCIVLVSDWLGARMLPSPPSPQEHLVEMRASKRAAARPTAAPSEDNSKLDSNNGSVVVVVI